MATLASRRRGWQVLILCAGAMLSYLLQLYLPLRMSISIAVRSALSACLIFGPFIVSLIIWSALPRWRLARSRQRLPVQGTLAQQPEPS